ncbi:TPA: hypothetical protein QCY71_003453 [Bacillus cereus]|nr:hypothetical protein [Bacillus cereus]
MQNRDIIYEFSINFDTSKLEKKIKGNNQKIRNIVSNVNPLSVLVNLYIKRKMEIIGDIEKSVHGNIEPWINKSLPFIQSIIVTSKTLNNRDIGEEEILFIQEELYQLFLNANMYINSVPKTELIKYSQGMQTNVSGIMYSYFEQEHFRDLLIPYERLFIDTFGIDAEEIVNGLLALSQRLRSNGIIDYLLEIIPNHKGDSEECFSEDVLQKIGEYFDVEKITNWPVSFIREFTLKPGEITTDDSSDYSKMVFQELPIKYKPFLLINNRYYCFCIENLIDNFYRAVLRALRRVNSKLVSRINDIQKELSEALPFKLFKKMIPNSHMFENIFYKAPVGGNGKYEWCECDGIILFDDIMIILEVKGGAFSPVSPFSDEEAYKESLKSLAQNPYEQSLRLFNEYKIKDKIEIYSKESKRKYSLLETINEVNYIYACCVTLDDFNEIAAQIEKTELIKESDLPVWCVSINDLRVYTEIFDSSSIFMNYLYQRSLAGKNPYIKLNDELDHIGLYFEFNNYSVYINEMVAETEAADLYIESFRDEIDLYMAGKANGIVSGKESGNSFESFFGPVVKPKQKMNPVFEQLIRLLDSNRDNLCNRVARNLLLLDSETRENISEFIESRTCRIMERGFRRNILIPYSAYNYKKEDRFDEIPVIMIFILEASNKILRDAVERKRFLMERVMYEDEDIICVLIGVNRNRELKKVITQIIGPEQFKAIPVERYEVLKNNREKIKESRTIKTK